MPQYLLSKNQTMGEYLPSFFELYVDSKYVDFKEGGIKNFAVFLHEYIHYLQDIFTSYGLQGLYNVSELIHDSYHRIPKNSDTFKIPIQIDNQNKVLLNLFVKQNCDGFYDKEINKIFLIDVIRYNHPVPYSNSPVNNLALVNLKILDKKTEKIAPFGASAIAESMAYIIERHGAKDVLSSPDYPYMSAECVASYYDADFASNPLNVLALCDMSLMCSAPGAQFVQFMMGIKAKVINISQPIDIYNYFYDRFDWEKFEIYVETVRNCLKNYLKNDICFRKYRKTIDCLFDNVLNIRKNRRTIFLELAQGVNDEGVNVVLKELISIFKSPVLTNGKCEYFSIGNDDFNLYIHAVKSVMELLHEGKDCCSMYEWCEKAYDVKVDDRCVFEPWVRTKGLWLCPFGIIWKKWGLANKTPVK